MKTLRRLVSLVLLASAMGSISACSPITANEDCTILPGSNNRCE